MWWGGGWAPFQLSAQRRKKKNETKPCGFHFCKADTICSAGTGHERPSFHRSEEEAAHISAHSSWINSPAEHERNKSSLSSIWRRMRRVFRRYVTYMTSPIVTWSRHQVTIDVLDDPFVYQLREVTWWTKSCQTRIGFRDCFEIYWHSHLDLSPSWVLLSLDTVSTPAFTWIMFITCTKFKKLQFLLLENSLIVAIVPKESLLMYH